MKKVLGKPLYIIVIAVAVGWLAWAVFIKDSVKMTVFKGDQYTLSLHSSPLFDYKFSSEKKREMENSVDVIREYDVRRMGRSIGTFTIVERTLGNGAVFLFERLKNDSKSTLHIKTELTFRGSVQLERKDWNPEKVEHDHHPVFGKDPTANPYGRIYDEKGNLGLEALQGRIYISRALVQKYPNGDVSRVRELSREFDKISLSRNSIEKQFKVGRSEFAETWALLARGPLFPSSEEEDEYIDFSLHNQASQLNWLTMDGPYTKLAFSIEPSTELGYGRVIGRMEDDVALDWHEKKPALFFESMVLNSRANLQYYLQEFEGTRWPSEFTSTWLKNAYGVHAPYVDTRYNEYVAFFLDRTARAFPDEVKDPKLYVPLYADYLISRVEKGEILPAGDGYLIVDYFDEDPGSSLTHASLNHELGGLKILLTAYQDTGDLRYLDVAERVIEGISSFGAAEGGWIRENGDLWYQARPDGTFSGNDYPQLTLLDLLETQALLERLGMERIGYFDEMIASKLAYLDSEGVELIGKVRDLLEE